MGKRDCGVTAYPRRALLSQNLFPIAFPKTDH